MKGPGERLKYNVHRVWECPLCHRRERSSFTVTYRFCLCQQELPATEQQPMKLERDGIRLAKKITAADGPAKSRRGSARRRRSEGRRR